MNECVASCATPCGDNRNDYAKIGDFISALSSDKRVRDVQVYNNRITVTYLI